ncbi:uncharacterized protein METZ01_LOCUS247083, partial [marine metagenome]
MIVNWKYALQRCRSRLMSSPAACLLLSLHLFLLIGLPYTVPLYLMSGIGVGFGRLLAFRWTEALPVGVCVWIGCYIPVMHLLSLAGWYGQLGPTFVLLLSVAVSVAGIFRERDCATPQQEASAGKYRFLSIVPLLIVMGLTIVHGYLFWLCSWW